jgi:RNase adaptor protein for sRNA GlmZ degradation
MPGSSQRRDRRLRAVKRVLLTGMSGTGKSSVIAELAALGYKAIDTDDGWCELLPDGRQRWREDAIAALLDTEDADVVFMAGCEDNQVRFHSRFDLIILLSVPAQVMTERLATRAGNPYGKAPGDMDRILADLAAVGPLLRKAADHEICTTISLAEVVAKILCLAGACAGGPCALGPDSA